MKILCLFSVVLLNLVGANSLVMAQQKLTAAIFLDSLAQGKKTLIDVRTAEEFAKGSLAGAQHIDWNTKTTFEEEIAKIDKSKPLYIFCQRGGRSARAATYLQEKGFQVYELQGGFMEVPAENRTAVTPADQPQTEALSHAAFTQLTNSQPMVLVDFTATHCAPCQTLKPLLQKIDGDQQLAVKVIYIDADQNKTLLQTLAVKATPHLQLYRAGKLVWEHSGLTTEEKLRTVLHSN